MTGIGGLCGVLLRIRFPQYDFENMGSRHERDPLETSRNKERFPADFAFRITKDEIKSMPDELQNGLHFEKNHYLPYAFTETGFSMLATLLSSETAAKANLDMISAVSATNSIQSLMQKFFETMKDYEPKKPF